jgi:uncharacterized protein (DUF58 family)
MEDIRRFWEGPPPGSEKELLRRVRKLEYRAMKNAFSFLRGNYVTAIRGKGMDFHEARKYVYGESIRQIDWNITARMGEPYVRTYNEEREREVFIVLDVSRSMHTGWQDTRKIEYAVEMAVSLAYSAVYAGDRLGFLTYSDKVIDFSLPREGKVQFMRGLTAFYRGAVEEAARTEYSDMRQAVHRIQRIKGKRFVIFFLSDFIEEDIPEDIRYLQAKHDVVLFHIYDPLEFERIEGLSFGTAAPEGRRVSARIAPGGICTLRKATNKIKSAAGTYNIRFKSLSTGDDMEKTLTELFYFLKRG